jgi:PadR family transcriptional regulator, regulatory protein PadR
VVRRARRTEQAVAEAATLQDARAAAGAPAARGGPGTADPLVGELRRAGLLRLLVLHFCAEGACYGNQLIERITSLTGGLVAVNPNTMYPLLRALEAEGLVAGEWEHPERRSRRFYRSTEEGVAEFERLRGHVGEALDRVADSVEALRRELAD